jgi:putative transcriptional regulator
MKKGNGNNATQPSRVTEFDGKSVLHYTACGLDNIYLLTGFEIRTNGAYSIEALDDLYACIASTLVTKKQELNGKEIRFIRKQLGYTQREIADDFGVDVQTVARWEKGETESGSLKLADRLMRVFYLLRTTDSDKVADKVKDLLSSIAFLDVQSDMEWIFEATDSESKWGLNDYKNAA